MSFQFGIDMIECIFYFSESLEEGLGEHWLYEARGQVKILFCVENCQGSKCEETLYLMA
jgi:hypothetical protein